MACVSNGLFCNCKAQITLTPFLFFSSSTLSPIKGTHSTHKAPTFSQTIHFKIENKIKSLH
jgi:hypothetical protein